MFTPPTVSIYYTLLEAIRCRSLMAFFIIKFMEIWKDIIWYEWLYQISNLGRIKSLAKKVRCRDFFIQRKERIKKNQTNRQWYVYIFLNMSWIRKQHSIHRLIWLHFIENQDNKPVINHINWIKSDNSIANLEWCTRSENELHAYRVLWKRKSN